MNINNFTVKVNKVLTSKVNAALTKSCLVVEAEAKRLCPVDTGTLRRSIESKVENNKGIVYTNIDYAPYIEYGTGNFAFDGEGRPATDEHPIPWRYQSEDGKWHTTYGQPAQPFMRPALRNKESEIINIFKEMLK